jgi:hypothetical protein
VLPYSLASDETAAINMTAHTLPRRPARRTRGVLMLPFVFIALLVAGAGIFVSFVLWPTWPSGPIPLDAPAIPVTVANVLFDIPPAAIRAAVQRRAGPQERIDLVFMWPSLAPPQAAGKDAPRAATADDAAAGAADTDQRLFVTIAKLGAVLPPAERLRTIYPRYVEAAAMAGPRGLAILPFRAGTPYEGEDLVYFADNPEQFFARCTRQVGAVRGTCLLERLIDPAEITLRFPSAWLDDWRAVSAGADRLIAQLHPPNN